ncbi:XRE family transcriptional regulator [Streptomyces sp. TRM66268-LWL]|uniref:XRE family transcriptional regulator n=1 Tax=Streptomyces polyasparticus TaxID=2767826 RepID=A0ABR7SAQ5_9ACTN|nr:helix-turn-helix transcriptional regulator [Streptomyces polyasparticus]MBC9711418.1 XRE family transcriptional regulator [Streptomyces polyasparticus]
MTAVSQTTPPFNALAARRLREALGMAPGHVAYGIRASYGLPHITPDTVLAWERGIAAPTSSELTALAGALWCTPGELLGAARTLREHRLARGLAPEDVARAVGLDHRTYLQMEQADDWRGSERQSTVLAEVLGLSPRAFATVTGRDARLTELLTSAATARWQPYVKPVGKLVPVPARHIERALESLHEEYHGRMTATLGWGDSGDTGEGARQFLAQVLDHFWSRVRAN